MFIPTTDLLLRSLCITKLFNFFCSGLLRRLVVDQYERDVLCSFLKSLLRLKHLFFFGWKLCITKLSTIPVASYNLHIFKNVKRFKNKVSIYLEFLSISLFFCMSVTSVKKKKTFFRSDLMNNWKADTLTVTFRSSCRSLLLHALLHPFAAGRV